MVQALSRHDGLWRKRMGEDVPRAWANPERRRDPIGAGNLTLRYLMRLVRPAQAQFGPRRWGALRQENTARMLDRVTRGTTQPHRAPGFKTLKTVTPFPKN